MLNLAISSPREAGFDEEMFSRVSGLLNAAVEKKEIPGAVAAVARHGRIVLLRAFGAAALYPSPRAVEVNTLYDLASLTKVVATLPVILGLLEDGLFRLDDPVALFLPEFAVNGKDRISLRQILSHTSGLTSWRDYRHYNSYQEILEAICQETPDVQPGTKIIYSDLGFILLTEVVRSLTGKTLDVLAQERIFSPLGMDDTFFCPPKAERSRTAATEYHEERRIYLCGEVHDDNASVLGGVSGHAGLFSTAQALLLYGQTWLNGGFLPGRGRILSSATVTAAISEQALFQGERRGLGWVLKSCASSSAGDLFSSEAYGHTGFTGTSLWIDPHLDLVAVLLTNRVHPSRKNTSILRLRPLFHNLLAAAVID